MVCACLSRRPGQLRLAEKLVPFPKDKEAHLKMVLPVLSIYTEASVPWDPWMVAQCWRLGCLSCFGLWCTETPKPQGLGHVDMARGGLRHRELGKT